MSEDAIFRKCAWRLIPFMMLLYLVNFVDRLNVGFAALTMNRDLGFTPSVFGFGAGIFFIGYALFQVPANLVLVRLGARRWIFCILAMWGLISASTAFVQRPTDFYALRFLLGAAEAGFFPGIIFYLTLWFPQFYRSRFTAIFSSAIPLSGIIGGPVSGAILTTTDGIAGLHGWQWLFLIEGAPAFLLAFAVLALLPNGPPFASWLSRREKDVIVSRLAGEAIAEHRNLWRALCDPRVFALAIVGFFGIGPGLYGTTLWLPQMVQAMGFSNLTTGFVVAVPYGTSVIAMILWGRSSDRKSERIWHMALPLLLAAAAFAGASVTHNYLLTLGALTLALVGILSIYGPFYSLPSSFLSGSAAAGGIALINGLGSFGSFMGPTVIGVLKERTGDYAAAMAMLAVCLVVAAVIVLALGRAMAPRTRKVAVGA
jgi:ACS family tartrate transporter-like MFS transporter